MSTRPFGRHRPAEPSEGDDYLPLMDAMSGVMLLFLLAAVAYQSNAIAAAAELDEQREEHDQALARAAAAEAEANAAQTQLAEWMARTAETERLLAIGRQWEAERLRIATLLEHALRESRLAEWGGEIVGDGLVVRIPDEAAVFEAGSDQLAPQFARLLDDFGPRLLDLLADSELRDAIRELRIEGHTSSEWRREATIDDALAHQYNVQLSQDRAGAVLEYLVATNLGQLNRDPELRRRLRAIGYGPAEPIVDPETGIEDRQRSRRVEFRIVLDSESAASDLVRQLGEVETR